MTPEVEIRLMKSFPRCFYNQSGELIVHEESNQYLIVSMCKTEFDLKCMILEWLSRSAVFTNPFHSNEKNRRLHSFILTGINSFLGTKFTENEMEQIYIELGNACNHGLTVEFVRSGYNMEVIRKEADTQ